MSNYFAPTRHPITNEIKMADWLDDSFGRHVYGVRFHGEEKIYPGKDCTEISPDEMLKEIEKLQAFATDHFRNLTKMIADENSEIERLRAQVEYERRWRIDAFESLAAQDDEIERLRAALDTIAGGNGLQMTWYSTAPMPLERYKENHYEMMQIARAALEGVKSDD